MEKGQCWINPRGVNEHTRECDFWEVGRGLPRPWFPPSATQELGEVRG